MKQYAVLRDEDDLDYVIVEFYGETRRMFKKDAVDFANDLRREALPAQARSQAATGLENLTTAQLKRITGSP